MEGWIRDWMEWMEWLEWRGWHASVGLAGMTWHGISPSLCSALLCSARLLLLLLLLLVSSSVVGDGDGSVFSLSMVFMQADRARDSDFSSSTYPLALANSEHGCAGLGCMDARGRSSVRKRRCWPQRYSGIAPFSNKLYIQN